MPPASSPVLRPAPAGWFPLWKPGLTWLLLLGPLLFASYGAANHWTKSLGEVPSVVFDWERHLPLWPWTILPYWSIDVFYGLSLLIARTRRELDRHALRLLTAQVLSIAGFLLFPLRFSVARPAQGGWSGAMFDGLTGFDLPYNQAPSLHIVLLVVLWDFYRRRLHGVGKAALHAWSALIAVSVLTTWQHHFIDVPTGVLTGLVCLWLWPLDGDRPRWAFTGSAPRRRLALRYAAGAAALLAAAVVLGRTAWGLGWPALSLAVVALNYAAAGAQGFQKRADGRPSLAVRWLLMPYRWAAWINARLWTRGRPASVPLEGGKGGVWLGRLPLPWEADARAGRFAAVVDVSAELSVRHPGLVVVPMLDLVSPSPQQLRDAADAVARAPRPVLVACALGYSRSAAVAATWLCRSGTAADVSQALALVRQARPQVVLSPVFVAAIEAAVAAEPRAERDADLHPGPHAAPAAHAVPERPREAAEVRS